MKKKEGFTKPGGVWKEEFFALFPPFEGVILGEKASILSQGAL